MGSFLYLSLLRSIYAKWCAKLFFQSIEKDPEIKIKDKSRYRAWSFWGVSFSTLGKGTGYCTEVEVLQIKGMTLSSFSALSFVGFVSRPNSTSARKDEAGPVHALLDWGLGPRGYINQIGWLFSGGFESLLKLSGKYPGTYGLRLHALDMFMARKVRGLSP